MKGAIFNFLVLQVVVWAFVFSTNEKNSSEEVNYASISDTWSVNKVAEGNADGVILHYPSFEKLTLNQDGTYIRTSGDAMIETGNWNINDDVSKLSLMHNNEIMSFDIVQLPNEKSKSFIIKEQVKESNTAGIIHYELTRI